MLLQEKINKKILVMVPNYLPGFKAGGPLRSIANLVDHLGDEFNFRIITSDRDLGDSQPYAGIPLNSWVKVSKAEVIYLPSKDQTITGIHRLLKNESYDLLYLNSFISRPFSMIPLWLMHSGWIQKKPVIIAPRGEFSAGALSIRAGRKKAYIASVKLLNLYKNITWQASSPHECNDIQRQFGKDIISELSGALPPVPHDLSKKYDQRLVFAPDPQMKLGGLRTLNDLVWHEKRAGRLKIVFLSRISKMKNLVGALTYLQGLQGEIDFDIYGPIEDEGYWAQCQDLIKQLPANIRVTYQGQVSHDAVETTLIHYHLFFLPTLGENYGHAIIEALAAGCPVLISDRTPWRGLEAQRVGWDIALEDQAGFRKALQACVNMGPLDYRLWSESAREYGYKEVSNPLPVIKHREMFNKIIENQSSLIH